MREPDSGLAGNRQSLAGLPRSVRGWARRQGVCRIFGSAFQGTQGGNLGRRALAELRRGWYLGGKGFAAKILESLATATRPKRRKGSVGGAAAVAHDAAEAEKIVTGGLSALDMPEDAVKPLQRGKWRHQKTLLAALVRQRTGVGNAWVAARLGMGHAINVTRATRRAREDRATARLLSDLASKLGL